MRVPTTTKQSIKGRSIEKEIGLLRDIYFNHFGVKATLLNTGEVYVNLVKGGKNVPNHNMILQSLKHYKDLFDKEDLSDCDAVYEGCKLLSPEPWQS